jgi:hypothetical protein
MKFIKLYIKINLNFSFSSSKILYKNLQKIIIIFQFLNIFLNIRLLNLNQLFFNLEILTLNI